MTENLQFAIDRIFSDRTVYQHAREHYDYTGPGNTNIRYMDIPIVNKTFEVPMFVLYKFAEAVEKHFDDGKEAIVVTIGSRNYTSKYTSLERIMQDMLLEPYSSKLVKVPVKTGDTFENFYCTHGAVFNTNFTPMFLCSWLIERVHFSAYDMRYKLLKPVIWMSPNVYTNKANKMTKFLADKVVTRTFQRVPAFPRNLGTRFMVGCTRYSSPKIVIDECPFTLHDAETPSISTTNEQLLGLALDHIEEIIQ